MTVMKLGWNAFRISMLFGKALCKGAIAIGFGGEFGRKLSRGALRDFVKTEKYVARLIDVIGIDMTEEDRKYLEGIYEKAYEIDF